MTRALLVVGLLLLAGCTAKDAPSTTTSMSTSPTSGASTTTTPPPTTEPSPSPLPSNGTGGSQPWGGYWEHDHTGPAGDVKLVVPANASPADITLGFRITATGFMPSCAAPNSTIELLDPAGARFANVSGGTNAYKCASTRVANATLVAGTWTLRFQGNDDVVGMASIIPNGSAGSAPTNVAASNRTFANFEHDYAKGDETRKFDLPEGVEKPSLVASFHAVAGPTGGSVCAGALKITLLRPDATVYFEAVATPNADPTFGGDPHDQHCAVVYQTAPSGATPAGTWTVTFSGQGQGVGQFRASDAP